MKKGLEKLAKVWRSDGSTAASQSTDNDSTTRNELSTASGSRTSGGPSAMDANTSSAIGWNIVDDLVGFLTLASGVLAGQLFQTAAAAPLEVLKIFQGRHVNHEHQDRLLKQLERLQAILNPVFKSPGSRKFHSTALRERSVRLSRALDDIVRSLNELRMQNFVRTHLLHVQVTGALSDATNAIEAALNEFNAEGSIQIQTEQWDQALLNLSQWLSPADGSGYDTKTEGGEPVTCFPGTRVQLLQDIDTWFSTPEGKPVFWLWGTAGTGKSTIARTVAKHWNEHRVLGGSFFFSRWEFKVTKPFLVFPTLAYRLCFNDSSFFENIYQSLKANLEVPASRSLQDQVDKLLLEPLLRSRPRQNIIGIVIDALDEGDEGTASIISLLASRISQLPFCLKVMVTSREAPLILNSFRSGSVQSMSSTFKLHNIEELTVSRDISLFLSAELEKIRPEGLPAPWPSGVQLNALLTKANNLFIYAATAVKFIGDPRWANPQQRLERLLSTKSGVPLGLSELDQMYRRLLKDAIASGDEFETELVARFQAVIGAIILLQSPLPATALEILLGEETNALSAVAALRSVFLVPDRQDADHEAIRTFHPSFPEFLLERCSRDAFFIDAPFHHARLACLCLRRMQEYLTAEWKEQHLFHPADTLIPHHIRYACLHWASHLAHCAIPNKALLMELRRFAKDHLLSWLGSLCLLKSLRTAVISLEIAIRCCSEDMFLSTLFRDARRLCLQFFDCISEDAAHIYLSALPFSPNCLLRETYQHHICRSFEVMQGQPLDWDACERLMDQHIDAVFSVTFSFDGCRIASGSRDNTLRIWDASSGEMLSTLKGHKDSVQSVVFSPTGDRVASGSRDRTVKLWDTASGEMLSILKHFDTVWSVGFSPSGHRICSGSDDRRVRVWDVESGKMLSVLAGHTGPVRSVSFSPNGDYIVSVSGDRTLRVWDTASNTMTSSWGQDTNLALTTKWQHMVVAFSPSGDRIATAHNTTLRLYDFVSGEILWRMEFIDVIRSLAFSPNGDRIASTCADEGRIWDVRTGVSLSKLDGKASSVSFSRNGDHIVGCDRNTGELRRLAPFSRVQVWHAASGGLLSAWPSPGRFLTFSPNCDHVAISLKAEVRVYDLTSHNLLSTLDNNRSPVAFSSDGFRIACTSYSLQTVRVYNVATGEILSSLLTDQYHLSGPIAFSPDGNYIASGHRGFVRLWDASSGALLSTLSRNSRAEAISLAFSPKGDCILSGAGDHTSEVWDVASGEMLWCWNYEASPVKDHSAPIMSVAFSPNGHHVAFGSDDHTVRVWDTKCETMFLTMDGHSDWVSSVAYSPEGSYIASGSNDKTVRVWDAESGRMLTTLQGHATTVYSVAFSPNGYHVASGSQDATVRLWDAMSRELLSPSRGGTELIRSEAIPPDGDQIRTAASSPYGGWIQFVALSTNGDRIASCSLDKTVRIWDVITGERLLTLKGHRDWVRTVTFSINDDRIASGAGDRTVRLWDATSGEMLATYVGHTEAVRKVAISPHGDRIASGSDDATILVWDVEGGNTPLKLQHKDWIWSVAFSPEGDRIASGSEETVRVWDARSGEMILKLKGHTHSVWFVLFSSDGSYLLSASSNDDSLVWDTRTGTRVVEFPPSEAPITSPDNWILHGHQKLCWVPPQYRVAKSFTSQGRYCVFYGKDLIILNFSRHIYFTG